MSEKYQVPENICPICYRPKTAHAADCDYEQKVEHHRKSEGITPEFEAGVKLGDITFEKQMKEVDSVLEKLKEPLPTLSNVEVEGIIKKYGDTIKKFETSRLAFSSHKSEDISRAIVVVEGLPELIGEIKMLNEKVINEAVKLASHNPHDPEVVDIVNEIETSVSEFVGLVLAFESKIAPFVE